MDHSISRNYLVGLAILGFFFITLGAAAFFSNKSAASTSCYANPGEICPSEEFLSEYRGVTALKKQVDEMRQSRAMKELEAKTDQFIGMGQRLGQAIPQGYTFDDKSMKFVRPAQPQPGPTRTIDAPPQTTAPTPQTVTPPAQPAAPASSATKPQEKK